MTELSTSATRGTSNYHALPAANAGSPRKKSPALKFPAPLPGLDSENPRSALTTPLRCGVRHSLISLRDDSFLRLVFRPNLIAFGRSASSKTLSWPETAPSRVVSLITLGLLFVGHPDECSKKKKKKKVLH